MTYSDQTTIDQSKTMKHRESRMNMKKTNMSNCAFGSLAKEVLQITADFARDVEHTVVIVSSQSNLEQIASCSNMSSGFTATTFMNEEILGYEELDDIKLMKLPENKQLIYLVIDVTYQLVEFLESMR